MSLTRPSVALLVGSLMVLCLAGSVAGLARAEASRHHESYRVNGVRFDVVTLQLAGDPGRIAEALAADGLTATRRGTAWTLGRQRGSLHETVELRAGDRPGVVNGRIAVVDLALRPTDPAAPPFRLPPGLRQLQVVEDLGAAERPIVSLIVSRVGVAATWSRLQRAMEAAGFSATARIPPDVGKAARGRVFEARGPAASVDGVIQPRARGSSVVLVHRRNSAEPAHAHR
jgi:hypothetical protein